MKKHLYLSMHTAPITMPPRRIPTLVRSATPISQTRFTMIEKPLEFFHHNRENPRPQQI